MKGLHPEPGHYELRLVKGGPWVGLLVYQPCPWVQPDLETPPSEWCRPTDRFDWRLRATLRGRAIDRARLDRIWAGARLCSPDRYHYLLALAGWADAHAPEQPEARPTRTVVLRDTPSLF